MLVQEPAQFLIADKNYSLLIGNLLWSQFIAISYTNISLTRAIINLKEEYPVDETISLIIGNFKGYLLKSSHHKPVFIRRSHSEVKFSFFFNLKKYNVGLGARRPSTILIRVPYPRYSIN